jgi:chromosome partitioning protein
MNYKGGVGKTTMTANLAAELARRGMKVLIIDLDPQTNLTFCFYSLPEWEKQLRDRLTLKSWFDGFHLGQPTTSLADLVVQPKAVNAMLKTSGGQLDLVSSHLGLVNLDLDLARGLSRDDTRFDEDLFHVRGALAHGLSDGRLPQYDLVLLDCPPSLNIVTQAALVAADSILIPAKADYLSTLGIEYLYGHLHDFIEAYNRDARRLLRVARHTKFEPDIAGVVFTMVKMYGKRPVKSQRESIGRVEKLGLPIFKTYFRESDALVGGNSPRGVPVVLRERTSSELGLELRQLTTEFYDSLASRRAAA